MLLYACDAQHPQYPMLGAGHDAGGLEPFLKSRPSRSINQEHSGSSATWTSQIPLMEILCDQNKPAVRVWSATVQMLAVRL